MHGVLHRTAETVDRSSLGGLFQPMALPEALPPARGRPRNRISTCSPFRPLEVNLKLRYNLLKFAYNTT